MKKLFINILLIFALSLTLASCTLEPVVDQEIFVTASFIPGACVSETKNQKYDIIEVDDYGRILFKYRAEFFVSGETEEFYVICQKSDNDGVYFYEDINYLIVSFDDDIEGLKKRNDWNMELDESKMSFRAATVSLDLNIVKQQETDIDYYDVREYFADKLNIDEEKIVDGIGTDIDSEGKRLNFYAVSANPRIVYAVICDSEYNIFYIKVTANKEYSTQISNLKKDAGWVYD